LHKVHGLDAVRSGLALAPTVVGVLVAAAVAERLARRYPQRRLVRAGFAVTAAGVALLLWPVLAGSAPFALAPGQLLLGAGLGTMLTSSVTLVQSAWPADAQGAVSGVSRAASNLGSSLGTALVGTAVAAGAASGGTPYAAALALLGGFTVAGFGMAVLLPGERRRGHPS
jgi:predicted MFS family arabinose efflux permease